VPAAITGGAVGAIVGALATFVGGPIAGAVVGGVAAAAAIAANMTGASSSTNAPASATPPATPITPTQVPPAGGVVGETPDTYFYTWFYWNGSYWAEQLMSQGTLRAVITALNSRMNDWRYGAVFHPEISPPTGAWVLTQVYGPGQTAASTGSN